MFEPTHYGLFFTKHHTHTARSNRSRKPFEGAIALLATMQPTPLLDDLLVSGLRHRFEDDTAAAHHGVERMLRESGALGLPGGISYVEACMVTIGVGQAFEMLRDGFPAALHDRWLAAYTQQAESLVNADEGGARLLHTIWRGALRVAAGVVLERDDLFEDGVRDFKAVINSEIHPEGYLPALVEKSEGGALERQLLAAKGLALTAEAATHAGTDLWAHEVRGISAKTAAIYAAAYYEYRDRWPWDEPPTPDDNEAMFKAHAGVFEMLNRHLRPDVLRDTLVKLRPVMDVTGGSLTTLTHGVVMRRGLFGR